MSSDQPNVSPTPASAAAPASDAATSALPPFSPSALLPRLLAVFPGAEVTLVSNPSPSAQHSLHVGAAHATDIARFLRDDPTLRLDYCSNVTGVDWPDKEVVETVKKTMPVVPSAAGAASAATSPPPIAAEAAPTAQAPAVATQTVEEKIKRIIPGHFEVVYHLYSMALKHGPVIIRMRTANRTDQVTVPSLTPIWRACEFQEREVFDLFGVGFEGHPDLRRILMWDEFKDHPMRRDYVEPDDYEWEPTAHGDVAEKAKRHVAKTEGLKS